MIKKYHNSLFIIATVVLIAGLFVVKNVFFPSYVVAHDNLRIDYHIKSPLFKIFNMKPGDLEERKIDITNKNKNKVLIYTKGIRTGGSTGDPQIEDALFMVIKNNDTPVYGEGSATGIKTLDDFFQESSRGVILNSIRPRQNKKFLFSVKFTDSAGNEYQAKHVNFDLIFGTKNIKFPKDKHECDKNNWRNFGELRFRNQSDCHRFIDD